MTPLPRPRLVLLHGTRMRGAQWQPYGDLLPECDLVMPDLPGHGERTDEEFTADGALATITEAVGAPSKDERVVLAGHSLGGYLAMLWAAAHPYEIDALVVLGATGDPSSRLAMLYRGFARSLPLVGHERMARVSNGLMGLLGADPGASSESAAYAALPAAWQLVVDRCGPNLLSGLSCPVVLANGQWDQMRVSVGRYARAAADPYPIVVPRATHLLPLTHPEAVAGVLRRGVALAG